MTMCAPARETYARGQPPSIGVDEEVGAGGGAACAPRAGLVEGAMSARAVASAIARDKGLWRCSIEGVRGPMAARRWLRKSSSRAAADVRNRPGFFEIQRHLR